MSSACELAAAGDVEGLRALPIEQLSILDSKGSAAVHWAASCGHSAALAWLIEEGSCDAESEGLISTRSKRRRPLHWAARNGQLEAVRYLVEVARVEPDPRDRQSVSPFQLAVWQCWLEVARYLVDRGGVDATQVNVFSCGAQHWLGTIPADRAGAGAEGALAMARWLKSCGLDFVAVQRQGHRPLHKAAWGGHLELCVWLRDNCDVVDDVQDQSGNFAADVAEMAGHTHITEWLRAECSGARARSCAALGLPPRTTCLVTIRSRYLELARQLHPDRWQGAGGEEQALPMSATDVAGVARSFDELRAAYHHLTEEGGRGSQANPTHSLRRMLRATAVEAAQQARGGAKPALSAQLQVRLPQSLEQLG